MERCLFEHCEKGLLCLRSGSGDSEMSRSVSVSSAFLGLTLALFG